MRACDLRPLLLPGLLIATLAACSGPEAPRQEAPAGEASSVPASRPGGAAVCTGLVVLPGGTMVLGYGEMEEHTGWVEARTPTGNPLWRTDTGFVFNPPELAPPGRMIVPNRTRNEYSILDARTGARMAGVGWGGALPRSWAVCPDGGIVLARGDAAVIARTDASGKIVWERPLPQDPVLVRTPAVAQDGRIATAVLRKEDSVILLHDPHGSEISRHTIPDDSDPKVLFTAGFDSEGTLVAYHAGRKEATFLFLDREGKLAGRLPATVSSNVVLLPGGDLLFVAGVRLQRVSRNGTTAWSVPVLPNATQVRSTGTWVHVVEPGRIRGFDLASGAPLWTVEDPGIDPMTPASVTGDGEVLFVPPGRDPVRRRLPSPP